MELYNLGRVSWENSQLIYHALAHLGREALSLVTPGAPYVCLGRHQDALQEVDLEFCRDSGIPVFRREVGGGGVYLDGDQFFYQLILRKDNPLAPLSREAFFRKFLQPVLNTYRRIGLPAEFKPINDVLVNSRKIAGTGVGEIGECVVFVGNLIADFNFGLMSRVLKVPDEKFRDKVKKTMEENMTTIRRELGEGANQWSNALLNEMLAEEFAQVLGPLSERAVDDELRAKVDQLSTWMLSEEWLHSKGKRLPERRIHIRSGVDVFRRLHKAAGGLIRADFEVQDGVFGVVSLSGDWFCYPADGIEALEKGLKGTAVESVSPTVAGFLAKHGVETPGVRLEDWVAVLKV
jgi:lipoate-protein ligase A